MSTARTIKEHKDSERAYWKRERSPTSRKLKRQRTLEEIEEYQKEQEAKDEKFMDVLDPEDRRKSKSIRKLREHIKKHRGRSANTSAEKPSSNKSEGYKGEACGMYRNAPCV